jgi:hypothetical protein
LPHKSGQEPVAWPAFCKQVRMQASSPAWADTPTTATAKVRKIWKRLASIVGGKVMEGKRSGEGRPDIKADPPHAEVIDS